MKITQEPFVLRKDLWYFWDEKWKKQYGPFETKKEAADKRKEHIKNVSSHQINIT